MSPFEVALLCGVIVAALVSLGDWRALLLLAAGTLDYIVTSLWYDLGLPLHPCFTAIVDSSVCVLIYLTAKQYGGRRWQLPLFTVFQFSVLVSFTKLFDGPDDYLYALLLELVNWCAILIIIGAGTARLADVASHRMGGWSLRRGHLHRIVAALYAPAHVRTWWWLKSFAQTA